MGVIYKATNKINGKSYIGQAIDFKVRKYIHKINSLSDNKIVFYKAIRKYGWNAFEWEILIECDNYELNDKEIEFIEKYGTYGKGYNMSKGGGGQIGYIHTEETRKKIARPGETNPMYGVHRFGKENPMYGKKQSDSAKDKIRKSAEGRKNEYLSIRNKNNIGKTYEEIYGVERAVEIRKKRSMKLSGENNPMYGKKNLRLVEYNKSRRKNGKKSTDNNGCQPGGF